MPVVALPSFVVISKQTLVMYDKGQTVFEYVC